MILRDVVKELTFLRKEHNREHGNLSEHSIYVVNGRGRLGRFYMDPPPAHLKAKANLFLPEMLMHSTCYHKIIFNF
ncbi:hypothetical protein ACFX1X_016687 [Malus domestica]|uniref:Uncharacterized protein n=1 Tax=Malus domestica TaxID=3750 RepID=A0A498HNP0_MALDO|nr:hypothetical protein DVH24_012760 [Malus domestica]